ncbi:hypothetical protein AAMO2058_000080300 [Amorphochlora amoebiformis]
MRPEARRLICIVGKKTYVVTPRTFARCATRQVFRVEADPESLRALLQYISRFSPVRKTDDYFQFLMNEKIFTVYTRPVGSFIEELTPTYFDLPPRSIAGPYHVSRAVWKVPPSPEFDHPNLAGVTSSGLETTKYDKYDAYGFYPGIFLKGLPLKPNARGPYCYMYSLDKKRAYTQPEVWTAYRLGAKPFRVRVGGFRGLSRELSPVIKSFLARAHFLKDPKVGLKAMSCGKNLPSLTLILSARHW